MVDAAIVVVEQTHKNLEIWERGGRREDYRAVIVRAVKQVAGPSFFALLVIAVSFLPVLMLEGQEGRLFRPLAYTKNLSMIIAAVLAITLDPALRLLFIRLREFTFNPGWLRRIANAALVGRIRPEDSHPVSRVLMRLYQPVAAWSLKRPYLVIAAAVLLMVSTVPIYARLGSEFMPPLEEGSILYMPTTMPGISITEAQKLLQVTDRVIRRFPEVERVLGKAGRAETSTDPAPLSMLETVVTLKPKSEWRRVDTWYSGWAPEWLKGLFRHITPDHIPQHQLIGEMNDALRLPGLSNAWTMPIKGRIDMLSTGLRTPVGIKVTGVDLDTIEEIGGRIESLLAKVPGTRNVFAERTASGYYYDVEWNRAELARYGFSMEEAQAAVERSIGGDNVTVTVEGRERYPVNVRYMRDFRSDVYDLERVLVGGTGDRPQVRLSQLAAVKPVSGPSMIRNEDGLLTGYVYIDLADRDPGSYIEEAAMLIKDSVRLPAGYAVSWSGEYESLVRVRDRLMVVVPVTLALILVLLYLNTRSAVKTAIVLLAVPFSAIGAFWFLYLLGYNLSIGVWVGLIALLGVDAETGVFMLLYLDLACEQARKEGRLGSLADLQAAIRYGAVQRLRPKFMTVATTFIGLVPILWSIGFGSDVMKRIAAPMIGGILTSFLLELVVYPPVYQIWKWNFIMKKEHDPVQQKEGLT
jgi:Cu(I)/Ag(I) efflux system membrane protein CusA/SilA